MNHPWRQRSAAAAIALASSASIAMPVQTAHNGAWIAPELAGQGLHLEILSPTRALVIWATFDNDGQQMWVYGDGKVIGESILLDAFRARDGAFPSQPVDATTESWGTLRLDMLGCDALTLSWQPTEAGFEAGELALSRLASAAGPACDVPESAWNFTDLGRLPVPASRGFGGPQVAISGGELLVASSNGVWRRPISSAIGWQASGLQGIDLWFIQHDPVSGRYYAGGDAGTTGQRPFFHSEDGGRSWINASSTPANHPLEEAPFEAFAALVVHPQDPTLMYANLGGSAGLAYTTDGGANWFRVDGQTEPLFGYACTITMLPEQPDRLYQGCEFGLDIVSIGYYPVDRDNPGGLGEFVVQLPDPTTGFEFDNRRPQRLGGSFARPGVLYAGIEGGLVAIDRQGKVEEIYYTPIGDETQPYLYVEDFWINPANPSHVIFGGGLNGYEDQVYLYESFDHGVSRSLLPVLPNNPVLDQELQSLLPLDSRGQRFALLVTEEDEPEAEKMAHIVVMTRARGER